MKRIAFILFFILFPGLMFAADRVDINTATLAQLDEITGIGPVLAQRIIDARPFSSVDDLLRVKGIGPKTLQKIKDQGLACVNCESTQAISNSQFLISNQTQSPNDQKNETPALPAVVYPSGIFINEVLPDPKGPDETDEWIELYNSNNSDVDLSGWQIQDTVGTITTYTILQNTKILANGFLIFKRPDTNIMLNNDQDGLILMSPDKKTVDSMTFASALLNQSYNKTDSGWQWSTTLTPGAKNIITAAQTIKTLPKVKISDNNKVEAAAADLSGAVNTNQDIRTTNPWFLFFTALATAIILSAIALFIKLKIFKNHVRT